MTTLHPKLEEIFKQSVRASKLTALPTVLGGRVAQTREKAIESYAKQLFLEDGIALIAVRKFIKKPCGTIKLRIVKNWRPFLQKFGLKKPLISYRKEEINMFGCELELSGKKIALAVDEERFCLRTTKHRKNLFFNIEEEELLRPSGFDGIKSIWEHILLEFKKIMPAIGLKAPIQYQYD